MNNMNMRRVLKLPVKPTLRMESGGQAGYLARNPAAAANQTASPSPGDMQWQANVAQAQAAPAAGGAFPMAATSTPAMEQQAATALRDNVAGFQRQSTALAGQVADAQKASGVPLPSTAPADSGMATSGIKQNQYNLAFGLLHSDKQTPMPQFKHGGDLRTGAGGVVPGTGHGDKIPAKYEPGEFVVSNDMLDAQPSLRGELQGLRKEVLAEKGMTPGQADAKAIQPQGLRAQSSFSGVQQEMFPKSTPSNVPLGAQAEIPMPAQPKPIIDPAGYTPPKVDHATGQYATQAKPNAVVEGGANSVGRTGGAAGGVPTTPVTGNPAKVNPFYRAGKAVGDAYRTTGILKPAGAIALASTVPTVANTSTEEYAKRFDGEAGQDLSHDVGLRAMGAISDFNNAFTFGHASKLANYVDGKGYVDDIEAGRSLKSPQTAAPTTPTRILPQASYSNEGRTPRTLDYAPAVGATDFTDKLNSRPDGKLPNTSGLRDNLIYKTVDPQTGRVTYSGNNIKADQAGGTTAMVDGDGRNLRYLDGNQSGSGVGTVTDPTTGKRLASAFSGDVNVGPDGFMPQTVQGSGGNFGQYAQPGASSTATLRSTDKVPSMLRAAADRGDTDALHNYFATKGEAFAGVNPADWKAQQEEEAAPKRGEFGYNHYQATKTARDANKATLRGQDMELERAMAPLRYAQEQRRMAGQLLQQTGGDLGAATKLAMRYGVDPTHLQAAWTADTSNRTAEQNIGDKNTARARDALKFYGRDKDGKPYEDTQLGNAAYELLQRQNPDWDQLTPTQRAPLLSDARNHADLIGNLRDHQNNSWWQALGIQKNDVTADHLPELKGAKLSEVGVGEGLTTRGTTRGDYKLTTGGKDFYLGRDKVSADHLAYLRKNGVHIPGDK